MRSGPAFRHSGRDAQTKGVQPMPDSNITKMALASAMKELMEKTPFSKIDVYKRQELDYSRKLNPTIPLVGDNDIPALHEIEFEMIL